MRRHRALIPLSHDHHHGLVRATRLRSAATGPEAERGDEAAAFLRFFESDTRRHFREEEERLFPLLADADKKATKLLAQALLEHQQLYALTGALDREAAAGQVSATSMRRVADALEGHIRFEERTLFPLIESVAPEDALQRLESVGGEGAIAQPSSPKAKGPLLGIETADLNATLLSWPAAEGPPEHVNVERDVIFVILAGSATITVDGNVRAVDAGAVIPVEKGTTRQITAGPDGVRYVAVHTRRPPLQISPPPRP